MSELLEKINKPNDIKNIDKRRVKEPNNTKILTIKVYLLFFI